MYLSKYLNFVLILYRSLLSPYIYDYHSTYYIQGLFYVYGGAKFHPMREDITYVRPALIGWDLVQAGIDRKQVQVTKLDW